MKGILEFMGQRHEGVNMLLYGEKQRVVFYRREGQDYKDDILYLLVLNVNFTSEYFELRGFQQEKAEFEEPEEGTVCAYIKARFIPQGVVNCTGQTEDKAVSS